MARSFFTRQAFLASGRTQSELEWGLRTGLWCHAGHGVYLDGAAEPTPFERAIGRMLASDGETSGLVSAKLLGFDGIILPEQPIPRRRRAPVCEKRVLVDGVWCTSALQTLVDIAPLVDDLVFEQALESALHKRLVTLDEIIDIVPLLARTRTSGTARIRRVLALRPQGAPPTESLLETLMVQLARQTDGVPDPTRPVVVRYEDGRFVARVDLAWPECGAFNELDGEHHKGQPVYDAVRQTNVATATGWLCGRFSWTEVRRTPINTGRRVRQFLATAAARMRG